MIGLNKLEQATNRRRCRLPTGQNGPIAMIIIIALLFSLIFGLYLIFASPSIPQSSPSALPSSEKAITDAKEFYEKLQDIIGLRVENESTTQQQGLLLFQQEQQRLAEYIHSKHSHSHFSSVLNSVYTPEPIYVPQVSYLLQLPGSCHPTTTTTTTTTSMEQSNEKMTNQLCQQCNDDLIAQYPTLLSKEYCQMYPMVVSYICDDVDGDENNDNVDKVKNNQKNQGSNDDNTNTKPRIEGEFVIVPCHSAYVDGTQQFWALYSISAIFAIASSIVVRRRFDKAKAKVIKTLVKPQ